MNCFNTDFNADLFRTLQDKAIKKVGNYSNLNKYFNEEWIKSIMEKKLSNGFPPLLHYLIYSDNSTMLTMDKVLGSFDVECKVFSEKIKRLKSCPHKGIFHYFKSTMVELYVCCYLKSKGFDCKLRSGTGADLLIDIDNTQVYIEITVKYPDLLGTMCDDILRRCLPQEIRNCYVVRPIGNFIDDKDLNSGMEDLLHQINNMKEFPEQFNITVGNKKQVNFQFTRSECGCIIRTDKANFFDPSKVYNEIKKKLNKKDQQVKDSKSNIIIVDVSNINYSHVLAMMDSFNGKEKYPFKIPQNIDAVVLYCHAFDRIEPLYVICTQQQGSAYKINPKVLRALGLKENLHIT